MKFAFGMPALILYPAIMSPWEADVPPGDILKIARKAEGAQFDWLTISEHIVMPGEMVEMMGARFPESLTAAAVLALAGTPLGAIDLEEAVELQDGGAVVTLPGGARHQLGVEFRSGDGGSGSQIAIEVDDEGHGLVVRNGHNKRREIDTGVGRVEIRQPRVDAPNLDLGERES